MQSKLSIFFNNIVRYLAIFCISFVWLNFKYPKFIPCVIISIIITALVCFLYSKLRYKKNAKTSTNAETEKLIKEISLNLGLLDYTQTLDYFYLVLSKLYTNTKKNKNKLIINNSNIVPYFNTALGIDDLQKIYSENNDCHLVILTNFVSQELTNYLSIVDLNVTILDINDIYHKLIEPSQILPTIKVRFKVTPKLRLKQLVEIALSKKNAKGYFLSGLFVMFTSFFYGYKIYYQIVATILFVLSLISLTNKKFNKVDDKDIFE